MASRIIKAARQRISATRAHRRRGMGLVMIMRPREVIGVAARSDLLRAALMMYGEHLERLS